MVISHRGGADVYPEQSIQALRESAAAGYYPEMGVQFLADDTPVLVHDDPVDRTMNWVAGPADELSPEDWDGATVMHPTGGPEEPAPFLDEALDELGGEIVLVPEIKPGASADQVSVVVDAVKARELTDSVLVQSFDLDTAQRVAADGLHALYLVGDESTVTTAELLDAGIEWLGVSAAMPAEDVDSFAAQGLRVLVYTLDASDDPTELPASVFGYFSDDPWSHAPR